MSESLQEKEQSVPHVSVQQIVEVGGHIGHSLKKSDSTMKKYIKGVVNNTTIIDPVLIASQVNKIYDYLVDKIKKNNAKVLFVCTKPGYEEFIKNEAAYSGTLFAINRWLGGTLTNFDVIKNSIKSFNTLKDNLANPLLLDQMEKKEIIKARKKFEKLEAVLAGLKDMRKIPDILIVLFPALNVNACKEAKKLGIPVIGICDTDVSTQYVDHVIPLNDENSDAVTFVVQVLNDAIVEARPDINRPTRQANNLPSEELTTDELLSQERYTDARKFKNIPKEKKRTGKALHVKPNVPSVVPYGTIVEQPKAVVAEEEVTPTEEPNTDGE